jgi:cytochrome P450
MSEESVVDVPVRLGFEHDVNAELRQGHHDAWDRVRDETPVFRSDAAGKWDLWYLLSYHDIHAALQQPGTFSSRSVSYLQEADHRWIPEELDPPEHTKYRQLLNPLLSPTRVAGLEQDIRELCTTLIDGFAPDGACDLVVDFARRFPTTIFMRLMGLPVEQADTFLEWVHRLMHLTQVDDPDGSIRADAAATIYAYLLELINDRRNESRDDIVSYLVGCTLDGRILSDDELREICFLLYMAGLDTVAGMLGYTFRHLATHPVHRALLREHPEMIPDAVEEFLRYYSIVTPSRVVAHDVDFAGCPMKASDRVVAPLAAANRDPQEFAKAEEFVIDRRPNRHIAFGAGPHRCLGSHLARLELRVALEEWHRQIPEYEIRAGAVLKQHIGGVAGLETLPLVWPV